MEWAERFERPPTLAQRNALADQIDDVNSGFDLVNLTQKKASSGYGSQIQRTTMSNRRFDM